VNSLSLALALISNISLLLNMTKRLSFSIAQPITVGGWYLASILLICLTAVFPRTVEMENYQLTQGYYYGIIAAAVYFLISSLMMITIYGAMANRYPKEFDLTHSQRTIMLQTILYMCYLLLGALVYSYVESWAYLDALYWANFTIMTTGIGDLSPKTDLGRALLFPFAIGGVLSRSHYRLH
jgi:potassium channel subfamily K